MTDLAVGVDIGGTSTRALSVCSTGAVAGRGTAEGANPNSHPPSKAAARVAAAVSAAVPADASVVACLLGMAGESKMSDPAIVAVFESALRSVGVTCRIDVVSDAEVAFASATSSPEGTVVIGGTGSVAARIADHRKTSWYGGWGWLLGDEGSAYWIGREAVRSTLRLLQGTGEAGPLAVAVMTDAFGSPEVAPADPAWRRKAVARLITSANAEPAVRLARYAAMVSGHASDPMAAAIIEQAAVLLSAHAQMVRAPGEQTPIVLAGSVIGPTSPVGLALREALSDEAEVLFAPDGASGAAWLAALLAWGPEAPRPTH
ncbi:N-acetylglucosamine kinase [Actinophytocola oryzae]|uniref:N-acetylglucosamine kinase-like BadF-type ATPase n=1 Tax=Actinophytocola oryzae TaxID=502181 RepID=A0A4R7UZ06_9PSEU|nr:BadF/BadG/BcrA/BcrD ATPase family protein [Actinophytocola oryzae]TDV40775.1 N-acetylglucosamine kinase-like BadF-type ATPase [Actinophytocola oryzae]